MPKEFFTEKDIEDLFRRGVTSLEVTDNVVLTELAYEKANRLGLRLVHPGAATPPSAPVRPYISQPEVRPTQAPAPAGPLPTVTGAPLPPLTTPAPPNSIPADLQSRIRSAVNARLGSQVDARLLDVIIQRVLNSTGVK